MRFRETSFSLVGLLVFFALPVFARLAQVDGFAVDATTTDRIVAARISLCKQPQDKMVARCLTAVTDSGGRFVFTGVSAGHYNLRGEAPGYLRDNLILDGHGISEFALGDGETRSVRLSLLREASLSGRVLDEKGQPISGMDVAAIRDDFSFGRHYLRRYQYWGGPSESSTDNKGEFRIGELKPGRYYLRADFGALKKVEPSILSKGYTPVYYPNAPTLASATGICVDVGEHRNTTFHLVPRSVFQVHGRLDLPVNFNRSFEPLSGLQDESGELLTHWTSTYDHRTRSFVLGPLPPGSYEAEFATGIYDTDPKARKKFTVTDADVEGLVVPMVLSFTLRANVHLPHGFHPHTLSSSRFRLEPDGDARIDDSGVPVTKDGVLTFTDLLPGHYRLYVFTEDPVYIQAARFGQQHVLAKGLSFDDPPTGVLDLTLASANAEIKGTVIGTARTVLTGADVKLIVSGPDSPYVVKSVPTDQSGQFLFTGVPPGKYDLVAMSETVRDSEFGSIEFAQVKRWAAQVEVEDDSRVNVELEAAKIQHIPYTCEGSFSGRLRGDGGR